MKQLTVQDVKEKFDDWRKIRRSKFEEMPQDLFNNLKELTKNNSINSLRKKIGFSYSTYKTLRNFKLIHIESQGIKKEDMFNREHRLNRNYTDKFKKSIISKIKKENMSIIDASVKFNIPKYLLYKWVGRGNTIGKIRTRNNIIKETINNFNSSKRHEILCDIQKVFENKRIDKVFTVDLINYLCEDPKSRWAVYNVNAPDKKITPGQLRKLLFDCGVHPSDKRVYINGVQKNGFKKSWFEKSWELYNLKQKNKDIIDIKEPRSPLNRYTKEFRQKILLQIEKEGLNMLEASKKFNIPFTNLYRWSKKRKQNQYNNQPQEGHNSLGTAPMAANKVYSLESRSQIVSSETPSETNKTLTINEFREYLKQFSNVTYNDGTFHIEANPNPVPGEYVPLHPSHQNEKIYKENIKIRLKHFIRKMENNLFVSKIFFSILIFMLWFIEIPKDNILYFFTVSYCLFNLIEYCIVAYYVQKSEKSLES